MILWPHKTRIWDHIAAATEAPTVLLSGGRSRATRLRNPSHSTHTSSPGPPSTTSVRCVNDSRFFMGGHGLVLRRICNVEIGTQLAYRSCWKCLHADV